MFRRLGSVAMVVGFALVSVVSMPAAAAVLQSSPADGPPVAVTFTDRSRVVLRIGPITQGTVPYTEVTVSLEGTEVVTKPIPVAGRYPYVWVTHLNRAPGTDYRYSVTMSDGVGSSAPTVVVGRTLGDAADNVLDLKVTRTEARLLVLNWRSAPVPTSYDVEITGPDGVSTTSSTSGVWWVADRLRPETTYSITVAGQTSAGDGGSETILVTTAPMVLGDPQLFLRFQSTRLVQLGWPQRPGIDSYDIFRDGELIAARTTQASGYNDFSIESETDYVYQVREVSNGREGPLSPPLSVHTLRDPFQTAPVVAVTYTDRTTIVLRVGPVAAGRSSVQVSLDGVVVAERPAPFAGQYPFVWVTLGDREPGTGYNYAVQVVAPDGTAGPLASVEVITRP